MIVLDAFLPYRLSRLAAELSAQTQAVYRRSYDLTVPEWRVLTLLASGGGITAKEVGQRSAMHKTKVSRAVKSLEDRRWLIRRDNEANRREEFLSLSPLGHSSFNEIAPRVQAFEAELLTRFGEGKDAILHAVGELERVLGITAKAGGKSKRR